MRLLLVEDNQNLGKGIHAGLNQAGYAVDWVKDGETAQSVLNSEEYDIAVIDIGLPGKSGLEVLEGLRNKGDNLPVLILTARDTINDRVMGLDSSADDYMVKPFDLDELNARIRALLRRCVGRSAPIIRHGSVEMDPAAHTIKKAGEIVELSNRAYAILQTLLENAGRVMSRSRLEQSLYSWKDDIESNVVEVHIHYIRKKLGNDLIRTIRGVGYIID